ncbi:MAG: NAD(P)/FAD-dependent oxidoreductase [ANME-2 cluster archaeon]|nr:NAD(P)/FAD-dependent oxidoreductase [ANME-2 cluster archaeon]MDF1531847.1 NAD(P)/FAD-dependent oxidoreductase [ANME-2 cluster archaeon]
MEKYDIIVVGAGPAGLGFSGTIKNKNVLVVDRKPELGIPVKSSAGTFTDTLTDFELEEAVRHSSKGFRIILGNGFTKEFHYEKPVLHSLDFPRMIKILSDKARMNCEMIHPASVENVTLKNGNIESIEIDKTLYKADLFVDASGEARVLLKHLNPSYYQRQWLAHGLEYEATGLDFDADSFDFFFSHTIIPEGYAWVFPTGKTTARIGLGKLVYQKGGTKKVNLKNALHEFISSGIITVKNFNENNINEIHGGTMTYYQPLKDPSFNNCFVIGDAASQSSCFLGEGIRFSLLSARKLALLLNSHDLETARLHYQTYISHMTRHFNMCKMFLHYYKLAPERGIYAFLKALSDYDETNMLRILRSEFKGTDFTRLLYTVPQNMF